jgi:hypothetical protein
LAAVGLLVRVTQIHGADEFSRRVYPPAPRFRDNGAGALRLELTLDATIASRYEAWD